MTKKKFTLRLLKSVLGRSVFHYLLTTLFSASCNASLFNDLVVLVLDAINFVLIWLFLTVSQARNSVKYLLL